MSSDMIDTACEREQIDTTRAIEAARHGTSLPYLGICHNCGEQLDMTARFCDKDCMDDYEKRERQCKNR